MTDRDTIRPNKRRSLTEQAYDALEARIVTGQLEPGMMVSEAQLAKALEMGRMPIRESLQRLARDGLVSIHPRRGVMIPEVSVNTELKLLEVRRPLQNLATRLAARRGSKQHREQMQSLANCLEQLATEQNAEEFLYVLRDVHHLLTEAAANEYIERAMGPVQGMTRRFWYLNMREGDLATGAGLHASIMRTVAEGNEQEAEDLSNSLMDYLEQFARRTLDI
ncbi:GntR family transcriptional regulator [Sedimenticola thiotaurini]|uniref:HTH gntR-type domain-containing protein n=1 Tax=Sedimenticola thiotaurini TaxID=1543721 RepID=A0A0F7JTU3_9GAMM|nr:GntR family transcriptional regulator [Sedimenticola thiotaurini]AKH19966.1 hypothetical protein AAY24_05945 [Sedimenticola thiotaurini]